MKNPSTFFPILLVLLVLASPWAWGSPALNALKQRTKPAQTEAELRQQRELEAAAAKQAADALAKQESERNAALAVAIPSTSSTLAAPAALETTVQSAELVTERVTERLQASESEQSRLNAEGLLKQQTLALASSKREAQARAEEIAKQTRAKADAKDSALASAEPEPATETQRFSGPRFVLKNDVVLDQLQRLQWTQQDSQKDLSWVQAGQFCSAKGFKLPSESELRALMRGAKSSTPCGSTACKLPTEFKLTSKYGFYWTSDRVGAPEAVVLALDFGTRANEPIESYHDLRALCVRTL